MQDYQQDETIESMAKRLIAAHHPHLKGAAIAYLMKLADPEAKTPAGRMGKRPKIASARGVPAAYRALTGFDFLIVADQKWWDRLDLAQHEAIIDHELMHCRRDEDGWYVADHDVEDFRAILERHGFYRAGLEEFCNAVQMTLPMEEGQGRAQRVQ